MVIRGGSMNQIEKAIHKLLNEKPFYAHFFLRSQVIYDDPKIPTAAAEVSREGLRLYFNNKYLSENTPEAVAGVIEHEVLHLLFEHTVVMHDKTLNKLVANVAMDASINQYITTLPEGCISIDGLNKELGMNLPKEETWEYYYYKLLQKAEELQKNGTGPMDVHGVGSEDAADPQFAKEILRQAMDQAVKSAAGNLPKEVAKVYTSLKPSTQISWKQVLANFIARHVSSSTRGSRKKRNRRFGLDQPGKVKKRELVLGICNDSSGSVSDDDYEKFMAEASRAIPHCNTTYVIDADCQVHDIQKLTKNKKLRMKRTGCGGTAYQPAITKCLELGCEAIVYFGDMDAADRKSV